MGPGTGRAGGPGKLGNRPGRRSVERIRGVMLGGQGPGRGAGGSVIRSSLTGLTHCVITLDAA
jgi:hypothetical protein